MIERLFLLVNPTASFTAYLWIYALLGMWVDTDSAKVAGSTRRILKLETTDRNYYIINK